MGINMKGRNRIMAIPTNIKTLLSGEVVEWARIEFKKTWDDEINQVKEAPSWMDC